MDPILQIIRIYNVFFNLLGNEITSHSALIHDYYARETKVRLALQCNVVKYITELYTYFSSVLKSLYYVIVS